MHRDAEGMKRHDGALLSEGLQKLVGKAFSWLAS